MKQKIVFVTSDLYYVKAFLSRQIQLAAAEYEVVLIVNADQKEAEQIIGNCGRVYNFSIHRKISLFRDFASLVRLIYFFICFRPDIVHSTTPKAGLLAMIASRIAGVKFRLHTFTGQVWQTRTGLMRRVLTWTDRITSGCSSFILADSHSQLELLTDLGITSAHASGVLGEGSICGVDSVRFVANSEVKDRMRRILGIPDGAVVYLYMARFTEDKGALAMADAYALIGEMSGRPAHLLMVGPDEESLIDVIKGKLAKVEGKYSLISYTDNPESYFQCCDVFCLPSYREGFPMVLLNAAACEIPVVASRIYGCSDAVVDGVTGFLFEAGNIAEFCGHLEKLAASPAIRERLGSEARTRVEAYFAADKVNALLMQVYRNKSIR